ncbi:glycosyl hydrolase family 20 [Stackebrandtia albiflava]|uniref:beta-N-acetylhexosaminidase n=1 Tax=Stackebrandtia albiflava TaxID=406432 RepID=A0A562VCR8_9ACTN|nr:glycoside hydrolase family 20 zincin-like fold domain-containing protein [Stackebrandtia albiflava]TWJ15655.1 glycosyl hydrolase family 20 [Stackebrandtia albiflava]
MAATELTLVPRPRRMETTGQAGCGIDTPVQRAHDASLPAQGFDLTVTEDTVSLRYADDAGARYGLALLDQIRGQSHGQLPAVHVSDWPDFAVRGFMLDISRGRVPTRDTLDRLLDLLDLVRINQLQLYTEHTFAYPGHEIVWRDASPMTPEDIAWLGDRCDALGIELVANQNTFGHMENWLRHPAYRHRAEIPDGFELFGQHRPATTLAPTQDNADFAIGLIDQLMPHFRSRRVNIGCDETWELGRGASAAEAASVGKGRVYADHLLRLLNPLLAKGYDVQFWGDIIAHHPELVPELPTGATAVAWTYEAPKPPVDWPAPVVAAFREAGVDPETLSAGFGHTASAFTDAGYPFWVAPGTSTWRSFLGRIDNAVGNLIDAAEVGMAHGAGGYLVTDWGDLGHMQPPSVSYPPIVFGAAVAWSLEANRDLDLTAVVDRYVFEDATGRLGAAMDGLARVWDRTGLITFNASPLFVAVTQARSTVAGAADVDRITEVVADIDRAVAEIAASSPDSRDADTVKAELTAAARLARHGGYRLLSEAGGKAPDGEALAADLDEAIGLHKEAWALRSRPGGIERGLAELERTAATYR